MDIDTGIDTIDTILYYRYMCPWKNRFLRKSVYMAFYLQDIFFCVCICGML